MTLDLTRRSLLKFMGGAVAGAVLSPLPWKLLDDASIWTQNWSRIARPPRGPVGWRDTTCTLCPGGCGLHARLIGTSFVSAWPQPGHPAGAPCALGLAAAQLRFHPSRVRGACRRDASHADAPWEVLDADSLVADVGRQLAELRGRGRDQRLAVLDLRPGRAMSRLYREFLDRQGGGLYLTTPDAWQASALAFATLTGASMLAPAPAPGRAGVVLAFGTPLLDSGAGPRLTEPANAARRPYHIQVGPRASMDAARADRWLTARPGSEAALALSLAHVLAGETLAAEPRLRALVDTPRPGEGTFGELLADFAPERVAAACGLPAAAIRDTARELAARRPALVLGAGDPGAGPLGAEEEAAVWCLNLLLGAPGPDAALGLRSTDEALFADDDATYVARQLDEVPDGSLDLLLVDGSFPGAPLSSGQLRRKLSGPGARIVALSPYAGGASGRAADVLLPTPAPGEWLDDVPTPALASGARYAWAAPVAAAPDWAVHPADWLSLLAAASGLAAAPTDGRAAHEAELIRRADRLRTAGLGTCFVSSRDGSVPVSAFADGGALADALRRGGVWTDQAVATLADGSAPLPGARGELATRWRALRDGRATAGMGVGAGSLVLLAGGGPVAAMGAVTAPVLNKLCRESELDAGSDRAALNPVTAREQGLADGATAELTTPFGARRVTVRHDASQPPGAIGLAAGPEPLDLGDPVAPGDVPGLCGAGLRPVWRLTGATLKEVRRVHA